MLCSVDSLFVKWFNIIVNCINIRLNDITHADNETKTYSTAAITASRRKPVLETPWDEALPLVSDLVLLSGFFKFNYSDD